MKIRDPDFHCTGRTGPTEVAQEFFADLRREKNSYLSSLQQKMKYLLPLSCFRLRQDFHKDQTFFCWSQCLLTLIWQNKLFFAAVNTKNRSLGNNKKKQKQKDMFIDMYSTIHCVHLFLKNQRSNSIFYFETKEIL